ncbi:TnpV protein [Anaerofustis stercorihominis]|uniref:TnpV protein n=1 Tax=Anaerofustis stercorihominis TaxID=214853 RepID=UPI0039840D4A
MIRTFSREEREERRLKIQKLFEQDDPKVEGMWNLDMDWMIDNMILDEDETKEEEKTRLSQMKADEEEYYKDWGMEPENMPKYLTEIENGKIVHYILEDTSKMYIPSKETKHHPKVKESWLELLGRVKLSYMEDFQKEMLKEMKADGTLMEYLVKEEYRLKSMEKKLIEDMKIKEGLTEEMKSSDQLGWVQKMNNITSRAREIVVDNL